MTYTIAQAISAYIDNVSLSRSAHTARTYENAMRAFADVLKDHRLDIETTPVTELKETLWAGLQPL